MKSFLASLAARAHGLAEVVQPRPRALFEPESPGGDGSVATPDVPAAPLRPIPRDPAPVGSPLSERVVEIERVLSTALPPVPVSASAAVPPDLAPPVSVSGATAPDQLTAPALLPIVATAPVPASAIRPVVATVLPPGLHLPRAALVSPILPRGSVATPAPEPAPPAAPSVTIRIERVDVRAMPSPTPIARTIAAARRANAGPALGDYLASRR